MPNEPCTNCDGDGTVEYIYGPPGSDRHAPASEIEWGEPSYRQCRACKGSGSRKRRPPARTGWVYFTPTGEVDHERTVNKAHADSVKRGNQGWDVEPSPQPSW